MKLSKYVERIRSCPDLRSRAYSFLQKYQADSRPASSLFELAAFKFALEELDVSQSVLGQPYACCYIYFSHTTKTSLCTRIGGVPSRPSGIAWPTCEDGAPMIFVAQFVLNRDLIKADGIGVCYDIILLFARDYGDIRSGVIPVDRPGVSLGTEVHVEGYSKAALANLRDDVYGPSVCHPSIRGNLICSVDYPNAVMPELIEHKFRSRLKFKGDIAYPSALFYAMTNIPISKICPGYWGTDRDSGIDVSDSNPGLPVSILQFCSIEEPREPESFILNDQAIVNKVAWPIEYVLVGDGFSYVVEMVKDGVSGWYT